MVITVWIDGSWRIQSALDAEYFSNGDPDFLVNIPLGKANAVSLPARIADVVNQWRKSQHATPEVKALLSDIDSCLQTN